MNEDNITTTTDQHDYVADWIGTATRGLRSVIVDLLRGEFDDDDSELLIRLVYVYRDLKVAREVRAREAAKVRTFTGVDEVAA